MIDNFYEHEVYKKLQKDLPAEYKMRLNMVVGLAIDYGIMKLANNLKRNIYDGNKKETA